MTKQAYEVTITATGTRMVGDQTGAEEHIKSEFIAFGADAIEASAGHLFDFVAHYDKVLDDVCVDSFTVTPHEED